MKPLCFHKINIKNSRKEVTKKTSYIPAWTPPRRVTLYVIGLSEHVASVLIPRLYPETVGCFRKGDIWLALLCLIIGRGMEGEGVKLQCLKFFTPKSILLWPTQIKEFSRKSYPPFNYHPLILWNFLVKLSSAKWKSWVRTKWENCSEHSF